MAVGYSHLIHAIVGGLYNRPYTSVQKWPIPARLSRFHLNIFLSFFGENIFQIMNFDLCIKQIFKNLRQCYSGNDLLSCAISDQQVDFGKWETRCLCTVCNAK